MKILLYCFLLLGTTAFAQTRTKRQASYTFPGPRSEPHRSRQPTVPIYQPQSPPSANSYSEGHNDAELYQTPRRQFQVQPVQYVHSRAAQAAPQAPQPQPVPVYEPPRAAAGPSPRQSYSAPASPPRKRASASSRANKYGSAPQQSLNGADEEEEEQGPDPLTLLLEDSSFTCSGKNDGYYADDSVNCQVFHYCVGGAKHSWMCPAGTLFHQVHLNCVNEGQDICSQSQKFHFVNDYLYKPIDYQGPNNTARYSQRYYPDGYVNGDAFVAPNEQGPRRPAAQPAPAYRPQAQSYPASAPAPAARPPTRQLAPPPPPPPSYNAPSQPSGYSPSSSSAASRGPSRSRPTQSYSAEIPQGYRAVAAAAPQSVPQSSYNSAPQEELYQQAPQTRRPASPPRSSTGYTPPRPQYRSTSARASPVQYPSYASNQAAGVQYDEDY